MTEMLETFFDRGIFMINMLVISSIFLIPLEKRKGTDLRMLFGVLACVAFSMFLPHTMFKYAAEVVAVGGYVYLLCAVSVQDAAYCVICAYVTQHLAYAVDKVIFQSGTGASLSFGYLLCCAVTYTLAYFLVARKLPDNGHYHVDTKFSLLSISMVLVFALCLNTVAGTYFKENPSPLFYVCKGYAVLCCVYALWAQVAQKKRVKAEQDLVIQQQLWNQKKTQYELTRQNIELINLKCHDLKHQVAALKQVIPAEQRQRYVEEIERSIQIYDCALETGSEVLDTVLTEKSLLCEQQQINMTCVADGSKLGFMDSIDVYTIFGNALDNAIESVSKVEDPERRLIAVTVWTKSDLLLIQVENYYEGEISFQDGLPVTSKDDQEHHGFGIKSIRYAVERYGGCMGIYPEDNMFLLRISIPLPEEKTA